MVGRYITVLEAARHFTVTPETIRRWISTGKLHASRLPGGREYRIFADDLQLALGLVSDLLTWAGA